MLVDNHRDAQSNVDRADRREQHEHKNAKDEEIKKFESYFSDKHAREAQADSRQRESLRARLDTLIDQRVSALLNQNSDQAARKHDAGEEIGEYSQKETSSAMTQVQGWTGSVQPELSESNTSDKDIHAVVRKILNEQVVFSNMSVQVSVNEEHKIDVSILEQKGKMVVCLSSGDQAINTLMANGKDIVERELHSAFAQQIFEVRVV